MTSYIFTNGIVLRMFHINQLQPALEAPQLGAQ